MTTHLCIHGDVFTRTQRIVDWIASRTGWPVLTAILGTPVYRDGEIIEGVRGRELTFGGSELGIR